MTRAQTQQALKRLPAKWALSILAIIVLYAVTQPMLNSRLGWKLPSLARLMGEPEPAQKISKDRPEAETKSTGRSKTKAVDDDEAADSKGGQRTSSRNDPDSTTTSSVAVEDEPPAKSGNKSTSKPTSDKTASDKPASQPASKSNPAASNSKAAADDDLLYGILKETGRERYVSIEGLQYNPGSEEGHRLKHLERHLSDMPDRPGKHGVFDGEMKVALRVIDDAFARAKRGAKGVRKQEEDGRTIYEVTFDKPIGFIGGRDGGRSGNPPAKRLRLVVEGSKFITGFPF